VVEGRRGALWAEHPHLLEAEGKLQELQRQGGG
jgi:hypothetical protein